MSGVIMAAILSRGGGGGGGGGDELKANPVDQWLTLPMHDRDKPNIHDFI